MNKKEYLADLLTICTEKQQQFFNRMYPNGVETNKLDNAISQIKNTILGLNTKCDKLKSVEEELVLEKEKSKKLDIENKNLNKQIVRLENEIDRFTDPIDIKNVEIQERLAILNALEAGGVDNWIWYGAALEQAGL